MGSLIANPAPDCCIIVVLDDTINQKSGYFFGFSWFPSSGAYLGTRKN